MKVIMNNTAAYLFHSYMFSTMSVQRTVIGLLAIASMFFAAPSAIVAQAPSQYTSTVLQAGEELEYEVSFLGITLGTIKMVTEQQSDLNGQKVFVCKSYIDSRQGIPFIELHSIFSSWIDQSGTFSRQFVANTKESENSWIYDKYLFDYDAGKFAAEKYLGKQLQERKEYVTNKKWNDGCSLFFTARQFLFAKRNIRIPTVMSGDTVFTTIAFTGKEENVEIDAIDHPVKTVYFNGEATWTGIYGVTGKFQGWFSNDAARIPIRAKMKLYVGNANIELVRWKRAGWTPPRGE